MLSDVSELFDGAAAAQIQDQRLTGRVVAAWARSASAYSATGHGAGGRFPSWEAMKDACHEGDLDWMFVVDCEKSNGFPFFTFFGTRLEKFADVFLTGTDDCGMSLLDKATADIAVTQAKAIPQFRNEKLVLCDGRKIQFRSVTAPLAADGQTISHIIGAVNGRLAHEHGPGLS